MSKVSLEMLLSENDVQIRPVVDFERGRDKLLSFDFTGAADEPDKSVISDTVRFSDWVSGKLAQHDCRYGIGGYNENRVLYASKALFGGKEEARSLHLGTDIWGPAGTPVYCPLPAAVHSFAFNDHYGDYGATIILRHTVNGAEFFSLYGHLSLNSIQGIAKGTEIKAGEKFADFGNEQENGHWPPHLHFQLMLAMNGMEGDYPGVCKPSEKEDWLANSPDPALILKCTF